MNSILDPPNVPMMFMTSAKRVAVGRRDPQTRTWDSYVIELARGASSRLTFDPGEDRFPVWSPDGSRIAWSANRDGAFQIYQKLASGVGPEELLRKSRRFYPSQQLVGGWPRPPFRSS